MENNKNALLKGIIERERFKIAKIKHSKAARETLKQTYAYYLNYKNKWVYLGLKRDVQRIFREILSKAYPNKYISEMPRNFFKDYIDKEYKKSCLKIKKTNIKKQKYYRERHLTSLKNKVKALNQEIRKIKEVIKS